MITISNDIEKDKEQIKNNESQKIKFFFEKLKVFLERDKYNLFKTKKSLSLDEKIDSTNLKIQKMINLKIKVNSEVENLTTIKNSLKEKNLNIAKTLLRKLRLKNEN